MPSREETDKRERAVAEWLLVPDGSDKRFEAEPSNWRPTKWHSRYGDGRMLKRDFNGLTYWQTVDKAPEFDLFFELRDVPLTSLLGRIVADTDADWAAARQLAKGAQRQRHVTVEVKSSEHRHARKGRALNDAYPAEFLKPGLQPSGFGLTQADLALLSVRSFCTDEKCSKEHCRENREGRKATHAMVGSTTFCP